MPLQLGLIGAYCKKELGDQVEIEIFKFVDEFVAAVKKAPPFLIGASNYLWNIDLGYKFVAAVKKEYPKVISVFGGPNYPDIPEEQETWLKQYPDIDFYVNKDGEVPFADLVSHLLAGESVKDIQKACLPSIHAIADGEFYFGAAAERLRDLTAIPSPYTMGLMDKFFDQKLVPPMQTNRGCPFTCTFCTEGGPYYTKVYKTSFERKKEEIDYIVARIKHTKTLRITDSNFGMFKEDVEFCRYLSEIQKEIGYPEYVMCSTGKNRKERVLECNTLLNNAMRLTASVQSLSPKVLEHIKRTNITLEDMMWLSDQTSETDTHSYSEIILALPGDNLEAEVESFQGLIDAGIGNVTQHQLSLIYGTEMSSQVSRERFQVDSMFRPIQRCLGKYRYGDDEITAIEIEEVCVGTELLSRDDYLESRRLYLSTGLFYNDRIFGEINALLRILNLSTFTWLKKIHDHRHEMPAELQELYEGFSKDTMGELWDGKKQLVKDVAAEIDRYIEGEAGGNIIYKYRSKSFVQHFDKLQQVAYHHLRQYLKEEGFDDLDVVENIERYARHQKGNVFDITRDYSEEFQFDIPRLIKDPAFARKGGTLEELRKRVTIKIQHEPDQKEQITRQLRFYGEDIAGLTMLISRFPMKRFYRRATVLN
ncbi:MAG: radical SAM protein [Desulfobulbaceae bacterium]|nr:radical SAM protein [Desulfobulbaceae bacterium]